MILFPLPVHADPRTAALVTAPLNHRGLFLPSELVHHFGLPAMTGYAGTDDDLPGTWLAAAETAHTVMLAGIVGSELMTTIGLTNRYQLFTPEHIMLDDDLYRRAANAFRDLELDEEELALDVIDAVGPGGHFLGQAHTRRHMKDTVERSIGQQLGPDGTHLRNPVEVARERGLDILERYAPEPLDATRRRSWPRSAPPPTPSSAKRRAGRRSPAPQTSSSPGSRARLHVAQHEPAPQREGRAYVEVGVGQDFCSAMPSAIATVSSAMGAMCCGASCSPRVLERPRVQLAIPVEELAQTWLQLVVTQDVRDELEEVAVGVHVHGQALVQLEQRPAALIAGGHRGELLDELGGLLVQDGVHQRRDEPGLAAEVIADQCRVLPRLFGDGLEREPAKALAREHASGGLEDARGRGRQVAVSDR